MSVKRKDLFINELKDYLKLLEISYNHFLTEELSSKILFQMKKIGETSIALINNDKKINRSMLDKFSYYIESIKTFDRKTIYTFGKELVESLK